MRPRLRPFSLRPWMVAACIGVCGAWAQAEPELQDPVSRLLAERGLIGPGAAAPPEPASFAQQVRDGASDMVLAAMNFLGVPYRRGGNSADTGFDCSGFTRHIFEMSLGLVLPRRADDQATAPGLFTIPKAELKPGDLVFFNTLRRTFSHVGIYIGDGKFIHAPRSGSSVRVEDMRMAYWQARFTGARRVDSAALPARPPLPAERPDAAVPFTAAPAPARTAAALPPQGANRAPDTTALLP